MAIDDQADPQAPENPLPVVADPAPVPDPVVPPLPPVPPLPLVPPLPPVPPPPNTPPVSTPVVPFEKADSRLIEEIAEFRADSEKRYSFNNGWDIVLSTLAIALSIAVVAVGFLKSEVYSAILGAVVGAVVTAQRAFPFGQRAGFYRLLIGQIRNLNTRATQGTLSKVEVINVLSSLRMDFAQQLPRGSSGPAPAPAPATPPPTPPADAPPPADADGDGQPKPA